MKKMDAKKKMRKDPITPELSVNLSVYAKTSVKDGNN